MAASGLLVEERAWLARVRAGPQGDICGSGFAIDERHLLTCAHVAAEAGATGPGNRVFVDFPLLGVGCWAEVLDEGWAEAVGASTAGDTAVLRLAEPVGGLVPVRLRSLRSVDGHRFSAYGFPDGHDDSVPTEGHLGKAAGREWVKLEVSSELVVQRGFSGAAVWSEQARAVVGMVVTRDVPSEGRVAFAVPVRVLAERSRTVAEALPSPLDLDPDRETHWGPRSRGVASDAEDGWLFSGRRRALSELVSWISSKDHPALRVVTGTPGSGKSALVARLVTTADRHYRRRIPGLDDHDPSVAPPGAVDVTFHASGRTVADLVTQVTNVAEVEGDSPAALLAALDSASRWPVLAVDALDESIEPKTMARVLVDLAERGVRILVGTRDHLLEELSDPDPIRIDGPPYLEAADVERYVRRLLEAERASALISESEVKELTAAAEGNFLVAQLVARALALGGDRTQPFPGRVHQAFERYLDALPGSQVVRDLLLPLAYAFGDGLPADELWLAAAAALRCRYDRADLEDLLASSAGSFLITRLDAARGDRYRLFHVAVAETLTARRDRRSDQQAIWRTWTEALPRDANGHSRWAQAPPYLHQHGTDHAAAAGLLAELVNQPAYLMVGDLDRLLVRLAQHPTDEVAAPRAILRLAAHRATSIEGRRRGALFALAAHHLGLTGFADALTACAQPQFIPRWAHSLGHPNQVLTGHTGTVFSVALGRVGGRDVVVSGGEDGTVRLWDPDSGRALGEPLTGHTDRVKSVALGRVGGRDVVVSGGEDETVRLWDPESRRALGEPLTGHTGMVNSVALGRVGGRDVVVSGSFDGTVRLWDPGSGRALGEPLTGHTGMVKSVALGRVGGRDVVVCASFDFDPLSTTVQLWDPESGRALGEPLTSDTDTVNSVALGRVGGRDVIVAGGYDRTVWLWDPDSGRARGEPLTGHTGTVNSVALGRVGGRDVVVSGGGDGTVRLWDPNWGRALGEPLTGHRGTVDSMALGQVGGRDVVVSSSSDLSDRTVRLWDANSGRPLGEPLTEVGWVLSVALGWVGGRDVVVSSSYNPLEGTTLELWDPYSGKALDEPLTGHTGAVWSLALGRVGRRDVVVSGSNNGTVRLWDPHEGTALGEPLIGHTGMVFSVALGRVGGRDVVISGGDDGTVRLWDPYSGTALGEPLSGHTRSVLSVALGRVGERDVVASGSTDGTVRLWDPDSGRALGEPLTGHTGPVRSVALGRVGGRDVVVSGSTDETIVVWEVGRPGAADVQVIDLFGPVRVVAIDDKGRVFVASGQALCAFDAPATPFGWVEADRPPGDDISRLPPMEHLREWARRLFAGFGDPSKGPSRR